jgi:hypothetical protein
MTGHVDVMDVWRPNAAFGPQEGWDYMENCWSMFPNPARRNAELAGGFSGSGIFWEQVPLMWPSVCFALLWFVVRYTAKQRIPLIAQYLGIKDAKTKDKFSYNLWLLMFYSSSALFGAFYVLPGEPYFKFPLDRVSGASLQNYHPQPTPARMYWYYMYQLGFYFAELYAIFVEPRRSDFVEYVLHHVVTIMLITVSFVTLEHRTGSLIIFIHDLPDVVLCASKMFHYTNRVNISSALFVLFAIVFFYLRIYCLPIVLYTLFCLNPQFHPANYLFWAEALTLGSALQTLQIFWFFMIIKVFVGIALRGNEGDPRESDADEEPQAVAGDTPRTATKKIAAKPPAKKTKQK